MILTSQVALVTGAAQGIGEAVAVTLAKNGSDVVVNDMESRHKEATALVDLIRKSGSRAEFIPADVSKYEEVGGLMARIKESFGRLKVVVNNAAILRDRTISKMTPNEWNEVLAVNLTGVYNVIHQALPLLMDGGKIVNISSVAGMLGSFGQSNYAASKGGINALTKSLARELGKRKITVNAVSPGLIKTGMSDQIPRERQRRILERIPLGEFGDPQDIANAVLFLVSDNARYITGEILQVNGGFY
ncbi:MAG: 3-oxoacyl-ACP reductase FabG [Deltaproteobacteria bacterium]|nr:3-oxoacyl-ACP reductase FabG [Deltaproteobacteria bacterium]